MDSEDELLCVLAATLLLKKTKAKNKKKRKYWVQEIYRERE
jgi:hypothetical protein